MSALIPRICAPRLTALQPRQAAAADKAGARARMARGEGARRSAVTPPEKERAHRRRPPRPPEPMGSSARAA